MLSNGNQLKHTLISITSVGSSFGTDLLNANFCWCKAKCNLDVRIDKRSVRVMLVYIAQVAVAEMARAHGESTGGCVQGRGTGASPLQPAGSPPPRGHTRLQSSRIERYNHSYCWLTISIIQFQWSTSSQNDNKTHSPPYIFIAVIHKI